MALTVLTPSSDWISGTTSLRTIAAIVSAEAPFFAESEATMTGEALMSMAETVGVSPVGSPAVARACSIAARVSFTFVP